MTTDLARARDVTIDVDTQAAFAFLARYREPTRRRHRYSLIGSNLRPPGVQGND